MSRHLPATRTPLPRVVHYVNPATPAELAYPLTPGQLAAKQRRDYVAYTRWKTRQAEIAERDRKVRRFWLGFGAVLALTLLLTIVVAGWLLWQFLAGLSLGVFAVPAILLIASGLAAGGHRCITVVQHWH